MSTPSNKKGSDNAISAIINSIMSLFVSDVFGLKMRYIRTPKTTPKNTRLSLMHDNMQN